MWSIVVQQRERSLHARHSDEQRTSRVVPQRRARGGETHTHACDDAIDDLSNGSCVGTADITVANEVDESWNGVHQM